MELFTGSGARHRAESVIEGLDLAYAAPAAACKVAEVPWAQAGILFMELSSKDDVLFFQRPHFHLRPEDQGHGCIERLESRNWEIGMHQLLENLRRGAERRTVPIGFDEEVPSRVSKWMGSSHRVHEEVGVDKDHVLDAPLLRD